MRSVPGTLGLVMWIAGLLPASCTLVDLTDLQSTGAGATNGSGGAQSSSVTGSTDASNASSGTGGAVATNDYLYVVGGRLTSAAPQTNLWASKIAADGSLAPYQAYSLPEPRQDHAALFADGKLFVIGGFTGAEVASAFSSPIGLDGSIGSWDMTASVLPQPTGRYAPASRGGRIYIAGGNDETSIIVQSNVLQGVVSNGTLAPLTVAANLGGMTYDAASAIAGDNYVVTGGLAPFATKVEIWPIAGDGTIGGAPFSGPALAPARDQHCAASATFGSDAYVYVAGGETGTTVLDSISYAKVSGSTLGAWATSTVTIGTPRRALACAVLGSQLYVVGGVGDSGISVVDVTRIELDTTSGAPTMAHLDQNLPEGRGFHQAVVVSLPTN